MHPNKIAARLFWGGWKNSTFFLNNLSVDPIYDILPGCFKIKENKSLTLISQNFQVLEIIAHRHLTNPAREPKKSNVYLIIHVREMFGLYHAV